MKGKGDKQGWREALAGFEKRVTKWVYTSVLNIVAYDRDPPWVYGKLSSVDLDDKKRIKAGFKELGKAFKGKKNDT